MAPRRTLRISPRGHRGLLSASLWVLLAVLAGCNGRSIQLSGSAEGGAGDEATGDEESADGTEDSASDDGDEDSTTGDDDGDAGRRRATGPQGAGAR